MFPFPPLVAATLLLPVRNTDGGVTVIDDLGRTVRLASPARRVVSLAPSITECLFAIGAGDRVAGVTDYCTFPPAAAVKDAETARDFQLSRAVEMLKGLQVFGAMSSATRPHVVHK